VAGCCSPRFYGKVFSERTARRDAARYRRKGLRASEREILEALRGRAETVLEVGGGVGALDIELVKAGAARVTNVELSPSYETEAAALAQEAGLAGQIDYRVANIAEEDLEPADAVVMHRVVCCYPDGELLVRRGAEHARRHLVLTFPRDAWWVRAAFGAMNAGLWALRMRFRVYAHPVEGLLAAAEGMRVAGGGRGAVWQTAVLER